MTQIEREKYWRAQVEGFERSGLSKAEYGRRNDVDPCALRYWERKIGSKASPLVKATEFATSRSGFVKLQPAPDMKPIAPPTVRLTLPGGIEFQSESYPDPKWLRAVMGVER